MSPPSPRSTIYEVAARACVSTATVSRVMSGDVVEGPARGFSDATRDRVLTAASDLGWVPNGSARGLAARRAGIVGLLFSELGKDADEESESPLFVDQVIRGAERAATLAGHAVLIASTSSEARPDMAVAVAGRVDGLVVFAGSVDDDELDRLTRMVPVVVLAARASDRPLDLLSSDNRGGSHAVTAHLLQAHGLTDLAFMAGPAASSDSSERFTGFADALGEAGLERPTTPTVSGGFTEAGGAQAMTALLDSPAPPRAVVCANDEMALGALRVLRSRGLRVPEDVVLTGFDDIAATRYVEPGLTTVRQPMRDLGERSVRMLLDRLDHPTAAPRAVVLPTSLVLRGSCGCATDPPAPTSPPPASTPSTQTTREPSA